MRTFVWVDAWQQQCCGSPFDVGSDVRWDVVPEPELHEWVDKLLGEEWGRRVEYSEKHHGYGNHVTVRISGVVTSIQVVTCDRVLGNPGGRLVEAMVPVRGSGRLRRVDTADPWEPEPTGNRSTSFDGWVVELEVTGS